MNTIVFANLRDTLSNLYSDENKIRVIIHDSGIKAALIGFSVAAKYIWHSVLEEAEKIDLVDTLLEVVKKDYGTNKELQKACEAYERAKPFDLYGKSSQKGHANSVESEHLNTEVYVVGIIEDKENKIKDNFKHPLARDAKEVRTWFFKELQPKEQSLLLATALFEGIGRQKLLEVMADIEKIVARDD